MDTISTVTVIAKGLWPNATDEFHARASNRTLHVDLRRTQHGEHFVAVRAYNPLAHTFLPRTDPMTEAEARDAVADVARFLENEYQGEFAGVRPPHCPPSWQAQRICPGCERFGTVTTTQEAWGDRTTCSACEYNHWYSIGD